MNFNRFHLRGLAAIGEQFPIVKERVWPCLSFIKLAQRGGSPTITSAISGSIMLSHRRIVILSHGNDPLYFHPIKARLALSKSCAIHLLIFLVLVHLVRLCPSKQIRILRKPLSSG